jgi:hypothetical protein
MTLSQKTDQLVTHSTPSVGRGLSLDTCSYVAPLGRILLTPKSRPRGRDFFMPLTHHQAFSIAAIRYVP